MDRTDGTFALDQHCVRFDSAWSTADRPPDLKVFLREVHVESADKLLELLLPIDVEHRRSRSLPCDFSHYAEYFPDRLDVVEKVLGAETVSLDGHDTAEHVTSEHDTAEEGELDPTQSYHLLDDGGMSSTTVRLAGTSADGSRFRILRPHARGGLGKVSVAEDVELRREVALKEILSQHADDPNSQARFTLEAEITGGLEHPGIVPVYGLGRYRDGRPYYAMRFIRGESLKVAIDRFHNGDPEASESSHGEATHPQRRAENSSPSFRSLEFRKLLGRFVDVCNALQYAHSRGIIHRDLKPGNIMLGKYGETLVVDWGLAKSIEGDDLIGAAGEEAKLAPTRDDRAARTQMGTALGTPAYMSPEQATGQIDQLGPACDIYSLGATLYHLLCGRAAFSSKQDVFQLLQEVQSGDFPPPRAIHREIPPPLEAICVKAMANDVSDRYCSAMDIAEEIERWLADEAVDAFPEPIWVRARRLARRHRTLLGTISAAVVVATISLAMSVWVLSGKNRALNTANAAFLAADNDRREAQIESLVNADADAVATILRSIESDFEVFEPRLRSLQESRALNDGQTLRLQLALVGTQPDLIPELLDRMLVAETAESLLLRDALSDVADQISDKFWGVFETDRDGRSMSRAKRIRAAAALAAYQPEDDRWDQIAEPVCEALISTSLTEAGPWADALLTVRERLIGPLWSISSLDQSISATQRSLATSILSKYVTGSPEQSVAMIASANNEQFHMLLPAVTATPKESAELLTSVVNSVPPRRWPERNIDDQRLSVGIDAFDSELLDSIRQSDGFISAEQALCPSLTIEQFLVISKGLEAYGYRPTRCRPFDTPAALRVAGIWVRDGRDWLVRSDRNRRQARQDLEELRQQGWRLVDLSGCLRTEPDGRHANRFVSVWTDNPTAEDWQAYVGFSTSQHQAAWQRLNDVNYKLENLCVFEGSDGGHRVYSAIFVPGNGDAWRFNIGYQLDWQRGSVAVNDLSYTQIDIHATPRFPFLDLEDSYREQIADADRALSLEAEFDRTEQIREATLSRAIAQYYLGKNEDSLRDLQSVIKLAEVSGDQGASERAHQDMEAILHARLGNREQALASLERFLDSNEDPGQRLYVATVVRAELGERRAALDQLRKVVVEHQNDLRVLIGGARALNLVAATIKEDSNQASVDRRELRRQAVRLLDRAVDRGFADVQQLRTRYGLYDLHDLDEFQKLLSKIGNRRVGVWEANEAFESKRIDARSAAEHLDEARIALSQSYRPVSVSAATDEVVSVWHRPRIAEEVWKSNANQKANALAALFELGDKEPAWETLASKSEPAVRSRLIQRLGTLQIPPGQWMTKYQQSEDDWLKTALLLIVGEPVVDPANITDRNELVASVSQIYRTDPRSGIHSAAEWLLRRLGADEVIRQFESTAPQPPGDRRWFLNSIGQPFVVLESDQPIILGDRRYGNARRKQLGRKFAIASRELSVSQYARCKQVFGQRADAGSDTDERPHHSISFYDAARFCNWLSRLEGLPPDQWCFIPNDDHQFDEGMSLAPNYLDRQGYRMPTQAEWEFAARSHSNTIHFFGSDNEMMSRYGWLNPYAEGRRHRCGLLRPNGFGLFDVYGNVSEWCLSRGDVTVAQQDEELLETITSADRLQSSGGSYWLDSEFANSAYLGAISTMNDSEWTGIRVARTLPNEPLEIEPKFGYQALWRPGTTITVCFLDGDESLHEHVRRIAPEWIEGANLKLRFVSGNAADIQISFDSSSGLWAYRGVGSLFVPAGQASMNLWIQPDSSTEHVRHSVLFAFGHALGLFKETRNPNADIPWNRDAVYQRMAASLGFTPRQVDLAYFAQWPADSFPIDKPFDEESIMLTDVPSEFTNNQFEAGQRHELSAGDREFIRKLYPFE